MAGELVEGVLRFEWDGEFESPHQIVLEGEATFNFGGNGDPLITTRNDVLIDRAVALGDGAPGHSRTIVILDPDGQPAYTFLQDDGGVQQVFDMSGGENRLSYSVVTWEIDGEPRDNFELIFEDHREFSGILVN